MLLRFVYSCLTLVLLVSDLFAEPIVTSVSYNNGTLTVIGENFVSLDPETDINASKISILGNGVTKFLSSANDVEITSSTNFVIVLTGTDKTAIDNILNRNGLKGWDNIDYLINFEAGWNGASSISTSSSINVLGVPNHPPTISSVSFTGIMYKDQELTGNFSGYFDLEGDQEGGSTYQWYRAADINGPDDAIAGATTNVYKITGDDLDKFLSVKVFPKAQTGTIDGPGVQSERKAVLNQAPTINSVSFSGSMYKGQEITCTYSGYTDLEGDLEGTSAYQWYWAADINGPDEIIAGATGNNYTIVEGELGKFLSVRVFPKAQTGAIDGPWLQSERKAVLNEAPKANNVYISGNMYLNQDISGNYGYSDLEGDDQGASVYKWYRADSESGPDDEIPGQTQTSYRISVADLNKYLSFEVTPVASEGTSPGETKRSVRLAVKNDKPKAGSVDFSGSMYLGHELTGAYAYSDLEGDPKGEPIYKWYRSDNAEGPDNLIANANGEKYTLSTDDINKYISFEVTPTATKGTSQGDPVRSSRKAVLNKAPEAISLSILGDNILGQRVKANYVYSDLEGDDKGQAEFQWFVAENINGPDNPVQDSILDQFGITRAYLGKYLSFTVIPKALEGTSPGEIRQSGRFYVNAAPAAINLTIKGTFKIMQQLEADYAYTDAENDPKATPEFKWYRANSSDGLGKELINGVNTKNYTIQPEDMNKYISFEYTPKAQSGSLLGETVSSTFMGPVENSEPVAKNVGISGTQIVCKTIRGEYQYEDLEGDDEGDSKYQWYRASSVSGTKEAIQGANARDYILTTEDQGKYLFFEVKPRAISGTTTGAATLSGPSGSISNTLPTVTFLGASSICKGESTNLTISFTGAAPWTLTYTDGSEQHQITSNSSAYSLSVSKAGVYKGVTLVDNLNCPVTNLTSSATITTLELPEVSIINLNSAYNYRGGPVSLTGNPSGGSFSGPGVIPSINMFYPSIAGTQNSPHKIIYKYTSPQTGCSNSDTATVEVIDAIASITGFRPLPAKYCNFDNTFVITGTNSAGKVGNFAITGGVGLTDNNNNTAVINPARLQAGNYTVSYSYFNGIQLTIYMDFTVEIFDDANIIGLTSNTYCNNGIPLELIGNYLGGVFTGDAVKKTAANKYYFDPSLATPGNTSITYSYTNSYGCVISKTVNKTIAPVPTSDFSVKNACYNGDSTAFKNNTLSEAAVNKWEWRFGDPVSSELDNRSTSFEPKHKYSAIGNRTVRLVAENVYGCKDTVEKTIHLGDMPKADFSWNSECFVKGSPLLFKNKSTAVDQITKYSWSIEDTSKFSFNYKTKDALHTFPIIRDYMVNLKVTSEYGCSDSVKKIISLRPIYNLKDTYYSTNFETGKNYWLPTDSTMLNNWKWGTPNGSKIKTAFSGSKSYYTSLKEVRRSQQLIITSPCFNFKDTDRPFITLETFSDAVKGQEGTVLQYSVNNGSNWENVGGYGTGINWYNDFAIQGQPAGQQIGWSDRYLGWANARHNLDFLRNDTLVRFRIVYGQNSKATATDGFAFDNILISNRAKNVLFEHFTNNSQLESLWANAYLDSVALLNKNDVVTIQYHTSFPGVDTLNMHNPSDPGSRVLYYGIGVTPLTFLEGGTESKYVYDFGSKKPNSNDIKNLSLKDNWFDLSFKVTKTSTKVSGTLNIKALKGISGRNISARVAVVENVVSQIAGYEVIYKNVVRKILPSAGGFSLPTSWNQGKTESVDFSWDYKNVYNPENVHIVAFLQDELSREIYQVVIDDTSRLVIGTGAKIKRPEKEWAINVYPNPAQNWLTVDLPETATNDLTIEIWSLKGKAVTSEKLLKGITRYETSVQNLENGFYFVRIIDMNKTVLATRKFAVVR